MYGCGIEAAAINKFSLFACLSQHLYKTHLFAAGLPHNTGTSMRFQDHIRKSSGSTQAVSRLTMAESWYMSNKTKAWSSVDEPTCPTFAERTLLFIHVTCVRLSTLPRRAAFLSYWFGFRQKQCLTETAIPHLSHALSLRFRLLYSIRSLNELRHDPCC